MFCIIYIIYAHQIIFTLYIYNIHDIFSIRRYKYTEVS